MKTLLFTYLLPTGLSIITFYVSYYFLLRRGSFFQLNRFFLLFALLFSFLLPFIHFENQTPEPQISYRAISGYIINSSPANTIATETPGKDFDWNAFLKMIYIGGIGFTLIRLLAQSGHILFLIVRFGISGSSIVLMQNNLPHFSFFGLIFINQKKVKDIDKLSVITHEKAHIKQCHFIDLLILEIATAFQWFNPVMWLYKRSLKGIHEYLADQAVLRSGAEKVNYCRLLVKQTTGFHLETLLNSFYYSSLKTRILMMTKKQNNRQNILKLCFILPVFSLLIFVFACESTGQIVHKFMTITQVDQFNEKDYQTSPDHPAIYKNGNKDVEAYFLSVFDFDNCVTTNESDIQMILYIDESGEVINSALKGLYLNSKNNNFGYQTIEQFKKMGAWKPATKDGKPVKSIYIFEGGKILRNAVKEKGLKIYTIKEFERTLSNNADERDAKYKTNPDRQAVYKNGDKDIVADFLSLIDPDSWEKNMVVTDSTSFQLVFYINESGEIDNFSTVSKQTDWSSLPDFSSKFKETGTWKPATKKGEPVKSIYIFEAGDILRAELKKRGLKVYTNREYMLHNW